MQLSERRVGTIAVLDLVGKLTLTDNPGRLKEKITSLIARGELNIVLNLAQLQLHRQLRPRRTGRVAHNGVARWRHREVGERGAARLGVARAHQARHDLRLLRVGSGSARELCRRRVGPRRRRSVSIPHPSGTAIIRPVMGARDVITNLRELSARTSTADGAQRLAWGPVWRDARAWFTGKLATLEIAPDDRRRRQQLGDAARHVRPHGHHRRASRFGAQWRLARWRARASWRRSKRCACSQRRRRRSPSRSSTGRTRKARDLAEAFSDRRPPAAACVLDDVRGLRRQAGDDVRRRAARERRRDRPHARRAPHLEGARRTRLPRAAHRAGSGARIDEQADRCRARDIRRRAPHAAVRRSGGAFRIDADSDASRRVSRGRGKRARVS